VAARNHRAAWRVSPSIAPAAREEDAVAERPTPGSSRGGTALDAEFTEFYLASYRRLAAQVYAYLGSAAEAEDAVQEAYLRAWRRWSEVSRYDDPVAWVRRVAWNLAVSRLRRLVTAARALRRLRPPDLDALGPDHVALVAALRTLPYRQRQAIVLHYIADMPVAEIAAELNTPRGTVLSWLSRGRSRLAEHLAETAPAPRVAAANNDGEGGGRRA
jgi:RNA polymerase sigma-70 factor (ECF subfamily)